MRIMGIDPGLRNTGYACIETGTTATIVPGRDAKLIEAGVIALKPAQPVADRLVELNTDMCDIIARLQPEVVAVEKLFTHYKHPTTAMIMGHARGVIFLTIRAAGLELVELGATEVKKSLTGNGHASKDQMQRAVQAHFALDAPPSPSDIADAMAIAVCAACRRLV